MTQEPHIVVACATQRGLACLRMLAGLLPHARFSVFSFREEPWEPPFLDEISAFCRMREMLFRETKDLLTTDAAAAWATSPPDLLIAVNWRYLMQRAVLSLPRKGAFLFHDSLLPAYRGFSPTVWAMINGESQTGATLLEMADEVDAGGIVDQAAVPIGDDDAIADVTQRVTEAYLCLLERNLPNLLAGSTRPIPQNHSLATFCCKRLPEDNRINWSLPAVQIHNLIRATSRPYPGAYASIAGRRMIIWSAKLMKGTRKYVGIVPGRVIEITKGEGVTVLTGDGVLRLCEVQVESEQITPAWLVLNRLAYTLN